MESRFSFGGQVAMVTGAGRGLGRAYAQALANAGAHVAVADIDLGRAREVAHELEADASAIAVQVDVGDEAATLAATELVLNEFGRIDILINNAGIYPLRDWTEVTVDEWDRVQGVNLRGSFLCARAVVPAMTRQERGKIVNVASSVVFRPKRNVHYVASKAGVIGLTHALARELGPRNIMVNAVSPGLIRADTSVLQPNEMFEQIVSEQCIQREGRPLDVVGAVLFLCSEFSDFITGQVLAVDGGWTMH